MGKGTLIIFEGIDHVGKSTIVNLIKEELKKVYPTIEVYQFPGKHEGTLGKLVYDIHHNLEKYNLNSIDPLSLQLLHIAAHVDILKSKIIPAIENGYIVLLDRYWWSTIAYGEGDGIPSTMLFKIVEVEKEITDNISNKVFIYVTRDNRIKDYSQDKEEVILHTYNELFNKEKSKSKYIIENNQEISTTINKVLTIIKENLK